MDQNNTKCWICDQEADQIDTIIRGNSKRLMSVCTNCDFHFFIKKIDGTIDIIEDEVDKKRLQSVGLEIPDIEKDFANGVEQSKPLIEVFLKGCNIGEDILEVGCSSGYFLKSARDYGMNVYGVELNKLRAKYVEHLGIQCRSSIEQYIDEGKTFDAIFLFYVFEYLDNPKKYILDLMRLLKNNGRIIIITPNLNDAIKNIYKNEAFINFFHDDCSIAYYSKLSIENLLDRLNLREVDIKIETKQGYSFINHINWFLNNKPKTTGIVGGDRFLEEMLLPLKTSFENSQLSQELITLMGSFDVEYKKVLEKYNLGNRIILEIKKRNAC